MIPLEITEDLRKGMSIEDCLIKHNTNLKILFDNESNKSHENDMRYIEKRGKRFNIRKKIKNCTCYFGGYSSFNDAQKVREELIRIGWKQDQVDNICHRLGIIRIPHTRNNHIYKERVKR